jgi:glycosyltransferase involved in cell wall biosynthesis
LLVHEWIEHAGGAEKVLDAFADAYTNADIFCLWNDDPDRYPGREVRESWLARTPLRGHKALSLPTLPLLWRHTSFGDYDWALISSHLFAHHAAANPKLRKIPTFVYAHTPARYLWAPDLDERGQRAEVRALAPTLKKFDRALATASTHLAANSEFVRERIQRSWKRDSVVIYPPVDVARISAVGNWATELSPTELLQLAALPEQFLLGASRLVEYKRLDEVILAGELTGLPVVIAGSGPDRLRLEAVAYDKKVDVHFMGRVSDSLLYALYQRAVAYVFPSIEDFGIMPVEAMAAGTPVVATTRGGAAESVLSERTGALVDFASHEDIRWAVDTAARISASDCVERAQLFDLPVFQKSIGEWLEQELISA